MTIEPRLRRFLMLSAVGGAAAVVGASTSWFLAADAAARTRVLSVDPSQTPDPDFDSATARISGTAGVQLRQALARLTPEVDSAIAIVLTAEDCLTCEDLGRQLRELQRATPLPIVVAAESISIPVVTTFLGREHLRAVQVVAIAHASVLADGRRFTTPAAFIVSTASGELSGVSHTRRFKYARARSFREELGFAGTEEHDWAPSPLKQEKTP